MEIKDKRMKIVNECFNNVRYVKLGATENYFLTRMCDVKVEELTLLKSVFLRITWISFMNRLSPTIFLLALVGFYALFEGGTGINVKIIFSGFSAYSTFSGVMSMFPFTMSFFLDVLVSGRRINEFLISEEINMDYISWHRQGQDN